MYTMRVALCVCLPDGRVQRCKERGEPVTAACCMRMKGFRGAEPGMLSGGARTRGVMGAKQRSARWPMAWMFGGPAYAQGR